MIKAKFIESLDDSVPPDFYDEYWRALWYIFQDDWSSAHDIVDGPPGITYAWMHAIVHRMEGDTWNANYWYNRAGIDGMNNSISEEKQRLMEHLLSQ